MEERKKNLEIARRQLIKASKRGKNKKNIKKIDFDLKKINEKLKFF